MTYALFALLILLNIGDWWTTRKVLKQGGRELNPIIRKVIAWLGIDGMLAFKLVIITGCGWALTEGGSLGLYGLVGLCAYYGWIVWHNSRQIK